METIKEEKKSEWEKEVVYNTVYLPVRFFKKEAYIRIDDYKEVMDKREKVVKWLEEEIWKLKLHIEAKDEAYMKLLKDYEELKENSETKEETLIKAIGDIFNKLKD